MQIEEMFEKHSKIWIDQNVGFFGVTPREWFEMSTQEIKDALRSDVEKYWIDDENLSEFPSLIYDGTSCRDSDKIVRDSIELRMNFISNCIDIFAEFDRAGKIDELLIASIPSPSPDLSWIINKNKYTPRISASRDYTIIHRDEDKDHIVRQYGLWEYNFKTKKFRSLRRGKNKIDINESSVIENMTPRSKALLKALNKKEVTEDNLIEALSKVQRLDRTSVLLYSFDHIEPFFNIIRDGSRFANPLRNIQLGVNTLFMRQNNGYNVSNKLVSSKSPIFSLENFRTAVYTFITTPERTHIPSFAFTDTKGLFDAFKTTTNEAAGRHRLLLDNVYTKDGMLYVSTEDGEDVDMFEFIINGHKNKNHISSISSSMFCNNNDPKRIMMTSKLSAQSVPVKGQESKFTNRVKARVVFGDFEGWSFADSILISQSFADKLEHTQTLKAEISYKSEIYESFKNEKKIGDVLTVYELQKIFPTKNVQELKNYEPATLKEIEPVSKTQIKVIIKAVIPFKLGDKVTNLHGSKGVVGKIIPDDEMPRLKNDIGDFKAGPFEVMISGFSVLRRGSMGQIFEAWANAQGIEFEPGEDFAKTAIKKYAKEMKDFSEKSIIEFKGTETIKPCGIVDIIRLYHHATTKTSLSYLKNNSNRMLNLGHMEKLNMVATGKINILKELSIRSTTKHNNALWHIHNLITNKSLPENPVVSSNFARVLKSTGLKLEIEGQSLVESDNTEEIILNKEYESILTGTSDDDVIDLYELYSKNDETSAT